jgi:hypothetical protein
VIGGTQSAEGSSRDPHRELMTDEDHCFTSMMI